MIPVLCDKIYLLVVPSQACRTIAHMSKRNRFCDHANLNTENPSLKIGLLYLVFREIAWIKAHTSNSLFKKKRDRTGALQSFTFSLTLKFLTKLFVFIFKIRKIIWNEKILLKAQMVRMSSIHNFRSLAWSKKKMTVKVFMFYM